MKNRLVSKVMLMIFAVAVFSIAYLTVEYYTGESYLTLKGDKSVTIGLNGLYEDAGIDAMLHGRDAGDQITKSGEVDTRVPEIGRAHV